ncbi:ABC transporter ATP-binding protein [Roseomonas sp. SSH11]|uniref:ABC transporter ATP-binding protein n=1 Tax=Pararoseomonas baculiformis TaxID=2820812 RepID=A0ABS4A9I7_9PROT|nr:ABC transporter ATP-binding protein [Pararoseomonas baculiformis]MBP0443654.1 ABC transporter ATP-binding protein [Pararoseomonas baculiformis]
MSAALGTDPSPLLRVEGLRRAFGGLVAVDGLSFSIRPGEILGLLGPNGSGKTTALNLISGVLAPDAGRVVLEGREVAGLPAHRLSRLGIARTFQLVRVLPGLSLEENVVAGLAFGRDPAWGTEARARAAALLERVGLGGRAAQPASVLTYGDQKRLELARALALSPRLLLLDEWLAGLNPTELRGGIDLIASLRDEGCTVLMVEHVMDAIRALADRCVVMNAGRSIAEGPPAEVLAERAVIQAYLGEDDA